MSHDEACGRQGERQQWGEFFSQLQLPIRIGEAALGLEHDVLEPALVLVKLRVTDIRTGGTDHISKTVSLPQWEGPVRAAQFIFDVCLSVLRHELAEQIVLMKGEGRPVRVLDPHAYGEQELREVSRWYFPTTGRGMRIL